jgi:hypothetical protein
MRIYLFVIVKPDYVLLSVSRIVKPMTAAVIKQHQAITVLGLFFG